METKYYFISYWYGTKNNTAGTWEYRPANDVIDIHPGQWQAECTAYAKQTGRQTRMVVFGWQEITVEDYAVMRNELTH